VYAEREMGGFFLDVKPDREAIARYGLSVREVLDVVESSIGGMDVATTYEGRERYQVNVRYPRELRDDIEALRGVLVPVPRLVPRDIRGGAPSVASMAGPMGAGTNGTGSGSSMASGAGMGPPGAMGAGGPASVVAAFPQGGAMGGGAMGGASPSMTSSSGAEAGGQPAFVPLGQLAAIETVMDAPMIKSEMGQLTGWIYVDIEGRDVGGYVSDAKAAVARAVNLPTGYTVKWTGQYESLERVRSRMAILLPLTIAIVALILYFNFGGFAQTLIVLTGVPFAAVGAIWLLYMMRFNTSIAVWVGMIALLGVAAETASVMVVYLDEAWTEGRKAGRLVTTADLVSAAVEAGSKRVRPLLMTVMTNIFGLLPVLLDTGVGSDVAKRIAAPMWGGLVSLTLLTLLVVPAMYVVWRSVQLRRGFSSSAP
jgi:Cu(I)/Ag(I) efflux system membrane protein CusA/SilA